MTESNEKHTSGYSVCVCVCVSCRHRGSVTREGRIRLALPFMELPSNYREKRLTRAHGSIYVGSSETVDHRDATLALGKSA